MPAGARPRPAAEFVVAALIAIACIVVSGLATWRVVAAQISAGAAASPRRTAIVTGPAGLRTVPPSRDPFATPGAGATGTAALPALPIPADWVPGGDGTVVPARPFSTALASGVDRGRALACLTAAIYYEAASESDDGQRAVAQVVLNRVRHPAFPATVCGVVYQGSDRNSGCQFSFACDGALARIPSRAGWARATRIAADALGGLVFTPVGLATHYHTYAVTPAWNRSLVMTDAIGAHFFHRWRGYWGTPAAFSQVYRGGEPMPGPLARVPEPATPLPLAVVAAAAPASTTVPALPIPATPAITSAQPAHADSGTGIPGSVAAAPATPDSQILDRWKDSGQPIR